MQGIRDDYALRSTPTPISTMLPASRKHPTALRATRCRSLRRRNHRHQEGQPDLAAKPRSGSYLMSYPKGFYRRDALYLLSDCYLRNKSATRPSER